VDGSSHPTLPNGDRPPASDTAPVRPALEAVRAAFANSPCEISVTCDPDLWLPADQVVQLGRIASEGVGNALKHAFPKGREGRIWLTCADERGRIRLAVRDNGVGIPDLGTRGGTGLALLEETARQLGGFARMGSAPFGGGELALVFSRSG